MAKPHITVLYFDGCPNGHAAYDLVNSVLQESGLHANVQLVEVEGPEEVRGLRFLGSPTILVNGQDVERSRRDDGDFAYACRMYRHNDGGARGLPPTNMILEAIRECRE